MEGGDLRKNNENSKSVSFFLPTTKYNRDLRAHKIKGITTVKRVMTVSCSIKQELFFLSIKSPWDIERLLCKFDLGCSIKFVLTTVSCQFNKLHWSYPTYYPHIYREILLTRQAGKHSLSILSQIVHCYKNRLCIA